MSVTGLPPQTIEELERAVSRARRASRSHTSRCTKGWACNRCDFYYDRITSAVARLEAVRSQQPERHITVDGADQRRYELEVTSE